LGGHDCLGCHRGQGGRDQQARKFQFHLRSPLVDVWQTGTTTWWPGTFPGNTRAIS
jgi:hypothetical protein